MVSTPLRVALVGCGQIADAHLQEIRKIRTAQPVAVCDQRLDLARQAAARFAVPGVFDDLERMLDTVRPDVLHVTTPPLAHARIACRALERGLHVYVEKPFTVNVAEADEVLQTAQRTGRLVCVGHDQLFDPLWQQCRQLHEQGVLGDIVHIDSIQPYDLNGPFGRLVMDNPDHWVHRLPGKLFHNVIPHALYKITEFLPDEEPQIWASAFGCRPQHDTPTELRVLLRGQRVSGQLLFSGSIRPLNRITRIYGTRQQLEIDFDSGMLRLPRRVVLPGALGRIEAPGRDLLAATRQFAGSLWKFLRCRLHYFAGMRGLFERFYDAIRQGGEPPISYREIRRVTLLLDRIYQAGSAEPHPAWGNGSIDAGACGGVRS